MAAQIIKTGIAVDLMPTPRPARIFVAVPVSEASAICLTGL
jgi:hypothetical protein